MRRLWCCGFIGAACGLGLATPASAQIFVRAPFVRVQVGPGVHVRAPFVDLHLPGGGYPGTIYGSGPFYPPGPYYGPALAPGQPLAPPPGIQLPPADLPAPNALPPAPNGAPQEKQMPPAANGDAPAPAAQGQTLEEFARNFQPRAGSYEATILNPITNQPTTVRFSLPEGTPRRVITNRRNLEFIYGPRQFVRIEFDRDGAEVTSRQ